MRNNKKNQKNAKKSQPKLKSLIIVDVQNDFCDPAGALYVNGAENIIQPIIDYATKNKDKLGQIIFTRDWHQKKDQSFKKNGGQWPVHCVQKTDGAQINKTLLDTLIRLRIPLTIVDKGTAYNHEEYGAFEHLGTFHHLFPNMEPSVKNCYFANYESSSGTRIVNEDLVICGVAGDYCVKETIKNLLKHWKNFNIEVLMNGTASIDDGSTLMQLIEEKNLKMI